MAIYIVAWFAVVLPLIGAGASFFADSARNAARVCRAFAILSFLLTLVALATRLKAAGQAPFDSFISFFVMTPTETTTFASRFQPELGVHVDSITAVFGALVAFVNVAIQSYASVALRGDEAYRRFFWAASLLLFAVLGLAYSPNLFQFLLLSGIASVALYILLLHWWDRSSAGVHARRTYLVFYTADLALLLAVVFVFVKLGVFSGSLPAPSGADIFDPFTFSGMQTLINGVTHAQVVGAGPRTLEVTSVLIIFVAFVRSAQIPFQAWLAEAVNAPVAVIALVTSAAAVSGVYLLAQVYPLLLAAPHVMAALAVLGAAGAAISAALAVTQSDVYRAGALIAASMLGTSVAALGAGGFGPGLYVLAAALVLSTVFFLAAGNVVRVYRSRNLDDLGGAWPRMRATCVALWAWALGVGGLSLAGYQALASALDNRFPGGGHLGAASRGFSIALLIVAEVAASAAALALARRVSGGVPVRRRGFQPERIGDTADAALRATIAVLVAGTALLLLSLPGVGLIHTGHRGAVGLSWMDLIVFGTSAPPIHVVFGALGIAILTLIGGAAVAWVLSQPEVETRIPQLPAMRALAGDLLLERVIPLAGRPFVAAGAMVSRFDDTVGETLAEAVGEGATFAAERAERVRRMRSNLYIAGAAAFAGILIVVSLLAATGHLGAVTL